MKYISSSQKVVRLELSSVDLVMWFGTHVCAGETNAVVVQFRSSDWSLWDGPPEQMGRVSFDLSQVTIFVILMGRSADTTACSILSFPTVSDLGQSSPKAL